MSDYITAGQIYTVLTWQIAAIAGIALSIWALRRATQTWAAALEANPEKAVIYSTITGFAAYLLNAMSPPLTAEWLNYRVRGTDLWPVITLWQLHIALILTIATALPFAIIAGVGIVNWLATVPDESGPRHQNRLQIGATIAICIYRDRQLTRFLQRWASKELDIKKLTIARRLSTRNELIRTELTTSPPIDMWAARTAINEQFRHADAINSIDVTEPNLVSAELTIDWKVPSSQPHWPARGAHI